MKHSNWMASENIHSTAACMYAWQRSGWTWIFGGFFVLLGENTTVASASQQRTKPESMMLIALNFIHSEWIRDENATNQPQNSTHFAMEYLSVFKCSPDLLAIVYCSTNTNFWLNFGHLCVYAGTQTLIKFSRWDASDLSNESGGGKIQLNRKIFRIELIFIFFSKYVNVSNSRNGVV